MPSHHGRASETTHGHPRNFIPGTNLIESMNARLRKVTRNRGQFPSEQAALKVLYLAGTCGTTGVRTSGSPAPAGNKRSKPP
jgi:hypothetical protein